MTTAHLTKRLRTEGPRKETSGKARRFYFFPAALLVFTATIISLLPSCAGLYRLNQDLPEEELKEADYIPPSFHWSPIEKSGGLAFYTRLPVISPRGSFAVHCVRINLASSGLARVTLPGSSPATGPEAADSKSRQPVLRLSSFAKKTGALVAVNTSPFASAHRLTGVHIASGRRYSPPQERYGALILSGSPAGGFTARIAESQTEEALAGADYAFGGFWQILKEGAVVEDFAIHHDARTAFGISDDSRTPDTEKIPDTMHIMGMKVGSIYNRDALSFDIYQLMKEYPKKVLIIHGSDDSIVPYSYSERAKNTFADAQLIRIEGANHGFGGKAAIYSGNLSLQFVKKILQEG